MSPMARKKQGEDDPFEMVRADHQSDIHPQCRQRRRAGENETTLLARCKSDVDMSAARKAHPWANNTWALIGGTHMLIVRGANQDMGTSAPDCPVATVSAGMRDVIDKLHSEYGNPIDTPKKGGPGQRLIFGQGLGVLEQWPKLDVLYNCAISRGASRQVRSAAASSLAVLAGGVERSRRRRGRRRRAE